MNKSDGIICPICGSTAIRDEHFKNQEYTGKYCVHCHVVFSRPLPTQDFLDNWYAQPTALTSCEDLSQGHNLRPGLWKSKEILRSCNEMLAAGAMGSLLDIGCHVGLFAKEMDRRELSVIGIDPNPEAVAFAREHTGIEAFVNTIDSLMFEPGSFDAITMWDVIEHLADPTASLRRLNRLIKPNGLLGVGTPNGNCLTRRFINLSRKLRGTTLGTMLDPPRHLYVFDRRSLAIALHSTGFEVVSDWTLDTYEVKKEQGDLADVSTVRRLVYQGLYKASRLFDAGDRLFVIARKV